MTDYRGINFIDEEKYAAMWRKSAAGDIGGVIAFCGFDGSGKTTQIELLKVFFQARNIKFLATRQPTDWYRSNNILRGFLDSGKEADQHFLALLAASDRRKHVVETIDPVILSGSWLISDRYVYSTLAFFAERGLDPNVVAGFNVDVPRPILTVLLDVPAEITLRRLTLRDGPNLKFEERDKDKIERIRSNFLAIAAIDSQILLVDGQQSPEAIHSQIVYRLNEVFPC